MSVTKCWNNLVSTKNPCFLLNDCTLKACTHDFSSFIADMRKDVQEIFRSTPHEKQVMMFSATLSKEIRPVCKKFMQDVGTIQNLTAPLMRLSDPLRPKEANVAKSFWGLLCKFVVVAILTSLWVEERRRQEKLKIKREDLGGRSGVLLGWIGRISREFYWCLVIIPCTNLQVTANSGGFRTTILDLWLLVLWIRARLFKYVIGSEYIIYNILIIKFSCPLNKMGAQISWHDSGALYQHRTLSHKDKEHLSIMWQWLFLKIKFSSFFSANGGLRWRWG